MSQDAKHQISNQRLHTRQNVIEAIAETMDLYGVTQSFGRLYGIMYFEDQPMTLEDMKSHMNMSKSNMSYAVRSLTESQMVLKLEEKRERKDLYMAETDFFLAFQNFFTQKLQREIDVMGTAINRAIPELEEIILDEHTSDIERKEALVDLHKLRHAKTYYEWMEQFVDSLKRGEYFKQLS
ncbi:transcriptional regulator [Bacillaceae bacterium SIJ1]|uniref:GbsR/MarR family transcriptional regulator n=1 Tax=Litoribacterium kuwaitense TaxID=1398745 RepID=UPI0013EBF939|nr:transcriptional regulator [Litoribacterium kuwaitense]NGP46031.1 transcriptional regulator [Litoribacterium kuwaitense]